MDDHCWSMMRKSRNFLGRLHRCQKVWNHFIEATNEEYVYIMKVNTACKRFKFRKVKILYASISNTMNMQKCMSFIYLFISQSDVRLERFSSKSVQITQFICIFNPVQHCYWDAEVDHQQLIITYLCNQKYASGIQPGHFCSEPPMTMFSFNAAL